MRILALDTATEACSVALLTGDPQCPGAEQIIERYEDTGKSHAQRILDMVDAALAQADIELSALDAIAASVGPGAFTGVRISVAVAQGLAFGAGLPVVPVLTLEALAMHAVGQGADRVLACLDARMGEVYWGCFASDAARGVISTSAPRVGPPDSVVLPAVLRASGPDRGFSGGNHRGIGRGFLAHPPLSALPGLRLSPEDGQALPRAAHMARLGALRFAAGEGIDPAALSPVYLRDKVALTEAERRPAGLR